MNFIQDRYLAPFTTFSLFMFQLLIVLVFIFVCIGCYWWATGKGYEPFVWGMKTLFPASVWGVIYYSLKIYQVKLSKEDESVE